MRFRGGQAELGPAASGLESPAPPKQSVPVAPWLVQIPSVRGRFRPNLASPPSGFGAICPTPLLEVPNWSNPASCVRTWSNAWQLRLIWTAFSLFFRRRQIVSCRTPIQLLSGQHVRMRRVVGRTSNSALRKIANLPPQWNSGNVRTRPPIVLSSQVCDMRPSAYNRGALDQTHSLIA